MNTTTLNMTTLDGGVIIKKGTAPAPPSGGESGGGDWHYFDVSELDMTDAIIGMSIIISTMMVKFDVTPKGVGIGSAGYYSLISGASQGNAKILAIGVDYTQHAITDGQDVLFGDMIAELKAQFGLVEITKEQFYTLD